MSCVVKTQMQIFQLFYIAKDFPESVDGKCFSNDSPLLCDYTFACLGDTIPVIIDHFYCQVDTSRFIKCCSGA